MAGTAEIPDDRWQRGRHDRLVERGEQHAEEHCEEHEIHPAAVNHAFRRRSRSQLDSQSTTALTRLVFRHDCEPDNISRVEPSNPVVRRFVAALNAGDRPAFFAVLTSDATMSDDGSERDLKEWTEREIFSSHGHMNVESEAADGQSLIAAYSNSTWGEMRTAWRFELSGDQIARFETGQA